MLADDNLLNMEKVFKISVHQMHTFLAHKFDKMTQEEKLRRGSNAIEL
tara:strand:- start:780 stop:923 length:144 start_codon:yes stop_codon:yes gene_type:complete